MADVRPLRAMRFAPEIAGPLADLVAPPYDVIDPGQRARLAARSPHNVVRIDLPEPATSAHDPYAHAAQILDDWRAQGAVVEEAEPSIWALTQDYIGPDGNRRTRRGFLCRVRVEEYGPGRIRPHERTHPGPKEDRLRLTRATRANLSPIFSLYSDPDARAWRSLEPHLVAPPWGEVTDEQDTTHRVWRVADAGALAGVAEATRDAELLIADGHHRYETARVYAEEIGGEGAHSYVLMVLVALEDPGLTIFPTHRLLRGLDDARRAALRDRIMRAFEVSEVAPDALAPSPPAGPGEPLRFGYLDGFHRRPLRLELTSPELVEAALAGSSDAYRRLDTAVLEALVLKDALGMSDDEIAHLDGLGYARSDDEARALVEAGEYQAAFFLAPTPVEDVQAIAAAGESMPPKSTFFHPKLLTGLVFNPLWGD